MQFYFPAIYMYALLIFQNYSHFCTFQIHSNLLFKVIYISLYFKFLSFYFHALHLMHFTIIRSFLHSLHIKLQVILFAKVFYTQITYFFCFVLKQQILLHITYDRLLASVLKIYRNNKIYKSVFTETVSISTR